MEKNNKKKIIIALIVTVSVILVAIGISYALWNITVSQESSNKISSACLDINLKDESETISLKNAFPITDEAAEKLTPYTFSVTNTCNTKIEYNVRLELMEDESMLSAEYVNLSFNGNGHKRLNEYTSVDATYNKDDYKGKEAYKFATGVLEQNESATYEIKLWMDEDVTTEDDVMNKTFISKVAVDAEVTNKYEEEILNGTDPVLADNLIPVTIADDGTVTKANIKKEWYNYENQEWANAVILEDETVTYNNGDIIPESNIESYFVWIPRYKYKIWDEGKYESLTTIDTEKVHTIQVEFETYETSISNGSTVNSWLTHPAFTSFGVNGIWVGKFESGYKGATSITSAQSNTNNPEKLQIKPNVYSWRNIQVANAHLTSFNYKRDMDSHMMKNTEWGAVAYLQHSAYGSQKSVRINNNSSYLTGYAGVVEPTTGFTGTNESCSTTPDACNENGTSSTITQPYNTETGYLASTTGNISGVYDMSGGAWEYMMGVNADSNGNPMSGRHNVYNSGFVGTYGCPTCTGSESGVDSSITTNTTGKEWPDAKYYDIYLYDNSYKNRILGDATGEMGPFQSMKYGTKTNRVGSWYADEGSFVDISYPWFHRGGGYTYGTSAGVFSFGKNHGRNHNTFSFRVVLAIN